MMRWIIILLLVPVVLSGQSWQKTPSGKWRVMNGAYVRLPEYVAPEEDTAELTILFEYDFETESLGTWTLTDFSDYFDGLNAFTRVSSGYNASWPNGYPEIVDATVDSLGESVTDRGLQLTQVEGTYGGDYGIDYRIVPLSTECMDSTDTDRYYTMHLQMVSSTAWNNTTAAFEWKVGSLRSGTAWPDLSLPAGEYDSTLFAAQNSTYDDAGYGEFGENRLQRFDYVKHKPLGKGVTGSNKFQYQNYFGGGFLEFFVQGDYLKYYREPTDSTTVFQRVHTGSPDYYLTLRMSKGETGKASDDVLEFFYEDSLCLTLSNDWWQEANSTGYDSMLFDTVGTIINQMSIEFLTGGGAEDTASGSDLQMIYLSGKLWQYSPTYDSGYYNQQSPWGRTLEGWSAITDGKRQFVPWWWLLVLIKRKQ